MVRAQLFPYTDEAVTEYGQIGTLRKAVTERRRYG